jgi:hypothetical protein
MHILKLEKLKQSLNLNFALQNELFKNIQELERIIKINTSHIITYECF